MGLLFITLTVSTWANVDGQEFHTYVTNEETNLMFKCNTHSLKGILAGFNKTLDQLDTFTGMANARAKTIENKMVSLTAEKASLQSDIQEANNVKANLRSLLGKEVSF